MFPIVLAIVLTSSVGAVDYVHSPIHYHEQTDSGAYNYGYDTGLHGSHQFHQEHKDANGQVRGRYGYTDPNGKLRLVQYTSGPQGFQIISDTEADKTSNPTVPKRQETAIANTIDGNEHRAPVYKTQYKPLDYFIKPGPTTTPRRYNRPYLSRVYRESNNENSRFYRAGRDYGRNYGRDYNRDYRRDYSRASVERHPVPVDRVLHMASSQPTVPFARTTTLINTHNMVRSHTHSAPITRHSPPLSLPTPVSYASRIPSSPISAPISYSRHIPESIPSSPPISAPVSYSSRIPAPIPASPIPVPPYDLDYIPAAPIAPPYSPLARRVPVIYSGRNLLSPVARLRAASLLARDGDQV